MQSEGVNLLSKWLQDAIKQSVPVQVSFSDGGLLVIDPEGGCFDSDMELDNLHLSEDGGVKLKPMPGALMGKRAQPLSCLLWAAQLHRLQEQMKSRNYEYQANLFQLVSWPCLTHLPEEIIPLTARICALLSYRRSTSALLIPSLVDAPPGAVFPIVETLHIYGHIQVLGEPQTKTQQAAAAADDSAGSLSSDSFVAKLWGRLRARQLKA